MSIRNDVSQRLAAEVVVADLPQLLDKLVEGGFPPDRRAAIDPSQVRITRIDDRAIQAWHDQWDGNRDDGKPWFDWDAASDQATSPGHLAIGEGGGAYDFPPQGRFDMAVWYGDTLCGLGCGHIKSVDEKSGVDIVFMEGLRRADNPLKGVLRFAMQDQLLRTAQALDLDEVRMVDPLPGADRLYEAMGYKLAEGRHPPLHDDHHSPNGYAYMALAARGTTVADSMKPRPAASVGTGPNP